MRKEDYMIIAGTMALVSFLKDYPSMKRGILTINVLLDALVRQDGATVNIYLISDGNIITQDSDVLQTSPAADGAVPSDNGRLDPGVVLDLAILHHDAALETDTVTNDNIGANDYVGTNTAVVSNLRRGVNHNVAAVHVRFGDRSQLLRVALGQRGEVQTGTGEEVLGLTDIHPEALEVEGMELAVLADGGECLLLDGGGAQLDAVEDAGVHDVNTGVDTVANELDGLLDEAVNAGGVVRLVNDDTVLGGLVNLGDDDGTLLTVGAVELGELLEGVVANDIGVQDEERRIILAQDLLRQLQRTSSAQRFGLDGELNAHTILLLVLLQGGDHHIGAVVDSQDNIGDTSSSQALDLVQDHGAVTKLHQRLREGEGLDN
jgi:hypothetical protein